MIDIGVNLTNSRFDKDRQELLDRAKKSGLSALLVTGTNIKESQQALALCQEYPNYLYSTAGIHPHDADNADVDFIEQVQQIACNSSVKAIGECGLDFNRNFSTPENQKRVFTAQIDLAARLNMPLFLHQRDAFDDWFSLLSPYFDRIPAMVSHCFTGNGVELQKCLDVGMYIGITGWLCDERRGKELRSIVSNIPLDRLMLETDAPYLTPRNICPRPKSSRNEPAYLPYVVSQLSECMQVSEQDIIEQTTRNAAQVFDLSPANE
ncbi:TatD family hydrolase [Colwelliaceae bacterium 6471]